MPDSRAPLSRGFARLRAAAEAAEGLQPAIFACFSLPVAAGFVCPRRTPGCAVALYASLAKRPYSISAAAVFALLTRRLPTPPR